MDHDDHVSLLRGGVPEARGAHAGLWADLGSGTGAFTLALADLLGPTGEIYSVDRDRRALQRQQDVLRARFPATTVHYLTADFTQPLALPPLDGIVMANSLHFVRDKAPVLSAARALLQPGGRLLLVEYNTDRGNPFVPRPLSYASWEVAARRAGFAETRRLAARPSRFLREIYSAISV